MHHQNTQILPFFYLFFAPFEAVLRIRSPTLRHARMSGEGAQICPQYTSVSGCLLWDRHPTPMPTLPRQLSLKDEEQADHLPSKEGPSPPEAL